MSSMNAGLKLVIETDESTVAAAAKEVEAFSSTLRDA